MKFRVDITFPGVNGDVTERTCNLDKRAAVAFFQKVQDDDKVKNVTMWELRARDLIFAVYEKYDNIRYLDDDNFIITSERNGEIQISETRAGVLEAVLCFKHLQKNENITHINVTHEEFGCVVMEYEKYI